MPQEGFTKGNHRQSFIEIFPCSTVRRPLPCPMDIREEIENQIRDLGVRLDYFILGSSIAAFAFVADKLEPVRLGINTHTLEVLTLACIALASLFTIERLQRLQGLLSMKREAEDAIRNLKVLDQATLEGKDVKTPRDGILTPLGAAEKRSLMLAKLGIAQQMAKEISDKMGRRYLLRNVLLFFALVLFGLAKILPPYLPESTTALQDFDSNSADEKQLLPKAMDGEVGGATIQDDQSKEDSPP